MANSDDKSASNGSDNNGAEQGNSPKGSPEYWRRAFVYLTGMGMTPEEKQRFEDDRDAKFADNQRKRCEGFRDYLLQYSKAASCLSFPFCCLYNAFITKFSVR